MRPARPPTSTSGASRLQRAHALGAAAIAAALAGAAACASFGGVRPPFAPLPGAVVFSSPDAVGTVLTTLQDSLTVRGFAIQTLAPAEGYLETGWFDLRSRAAVPEPIGGFERVVKLRFFVDPVGQHTRVIAEAVQRAGWDPSRPARELEVMTPVDHPGRLLMDSVLARVPRGTTTGTPAAPR